ncbi:hypothetical protein V1264_014058 [Littorina saxatilis]|uniref:Uncharacterized protein n=1 Tax=Littorina saxatilis TaxID=31220 RepID=A0AAN9GII9_9CAEN
MDCRARVSAAILQAEMHMNNAQMDLQQYLSNKRRRRRRGQRRRYWSRSWLSPERRRQFGLYDQLRREDPAAFCNFMRMQPETFDEILTRVGPRITKTQTWFWEPLEPGLKLALTLRHLASGATYMDIYMRYGLRVPHNTISLAVREVCQAIVDEYLDEVMPLPTDAGDWQEIVDGFKEKWNFPHTLGALDGKHIGVNLLQLQEVLLCTAPWFGRRRLHICLGGFWWTRRCR